MSQLEKQPESPSDSLQPGDSKAIPPPPDGGLTAWLQVLCMHFTFFNSWGVSNSFSVFEQLYTAELGKSSSEIAWIGSVQVSLLFFLGAFAGRATDAGYFRIVYHHWRFSASLWALHAFSLQDLLADLSRSSCVYGPW